MMRRRHRHARLAFFASLVALVAIGAAAMAFDSNPGGDSGIFPPLPETKETTVSAPAHEPAPAEPEDEHEHVEAEPISLPPGMARLAGPPESVVRRFADAWANRNAVLTAATKREMIGLSAGAWAGAVYQEARLTLPAIEGVQAVGGMEMMRLTDVAPGSKTALVVTKEQLISPAGEPTTPRYEIYLARLDRVTPQGYAITAWEPQR